MFDRSYTTLVHDLLFGAKVNMKQLSSDLDMAHSTLRGQLTSDNPETARSHKLGLDTALQALSKSGLMGHFLSHIAYEHGYTVTNDSREPNGKDLADECIQGYQAVAAFIQAVRDGADTGEIVRLCCEATEEIQDVAKRVRIERNPGLKAI